ncbi:MAG TPA: Ig-like domain-containing protein [Candidatus Kryptonia bacterium]
MRWMFIPVVLLFSLDVFGQKTEELEKYFQSASGEFNVPQPILEGMAYIQTRWTQISYTPQELANRPSEAQPPSFGVMGLRDDNWFGHSLDSAARLVALSPDTLKSSAYENVRGAAALLAEYRDEANETTKTVGEDLSSWSSVIARFSGIPQEDIAAEFAYHTLQYLQKGVNESGIYIPPQKVDLTNFPASVKAKGMWMNQKSTRAEQPESIKSGGADYPGAYWNPSQNYGSRAGAPIVFVIIHDTEGSFDASVSWLLNPAAQASSHYIIRSSDGYIEQLVHESDEAWGVRCWNPITISIEHEGYVSNPSYFTEVMYESSAHLTQYLCAKYAIAEDSLHIFGHDAWTYSWFNLIPFSQYTQYVGSSYATCNDHTDPGQYWNWHHYFDLIRSYDTTKPSVVSSTPTEGDTAVPAFANLNVTFSNPMDPATTLSAFSITPSVDGQSSLSLNGTQLTFTHPDSLLRWSTTYTITVDTSAKGSNGRHIAAPYVAQFTTVPIDTTGPTLLVASPQSGGISALKSFFEFILNEPVQYNSLPARIALVDSNGNKVSFTKDFFQITANNLSLMALRCASSLTPGMKYTASLSPGIADYYGNLSKSTYAITFIADTSGPSGGSVMDGLESSTGQWLQPTSSSLTFGIDTSASSFALSFRYYDGGSSGLLTYRFDSLHAECAVENLQGFDISGSYSVGMWIFGDNSRNELDYIFGSSTRKLVAVDTIDWYGWKYIGMWRDNADASTALLRGLAVRRLPSALLAGGTLYIDDVQQNGRVTGIHDGPSVQPASFELYQNYPNPFNPTTVIGYRLSANSYVTLKVYDVLGREIGALVDGRQNAGYHSVVFDAGNLPSGVYFYRIVTDNSRSIRKMLMVK